MNQVPKNRKRVYFDPPDNERCIATIEWGRGEAARCGKRKTSDSTFCAQHKKINDKKTENTNTPQVV